MSKQIRPDGFARDSSEHFSRLTVVVFTRNRPLFLARQVLHWQQFPVTLLILDGSDSPFNENLISSDNIQYFHGGSLLERMSLAGELIASPFALIAGDDDLLLPAGVADCVDILETNSGYVSCIGQALTFRPLFGLVHMFSSYQENIGFNNVSIDSRERVLRKVAPYTCAGWYAVQRGPVLAKSLSAVSAMKETGDLCPTLPAELIEILLEISTAIQGKMVSSQTVMWLRSLENPPQWKATEGGLSAWLRSELSGGKRPVWLSRVAEKLSQESMDTLEEIENLIEVGLRTYSQSEQALSLEYTKWQVALIRLNEQARMRLPTVASRIRPFTRPLGRLLAVRGLSRTLVVGTKSHPTLIYRQRKLRSLNLAVDESDLRRTVARIGDFHAS